MLCTAVPRPVKQQLLVFRETGQDINPVQLRQCQGVVGQPERPQSCHTCMRRQFASKHIPPSTFLVQESIHRYQTLATFA